MIATTAEPEVLLALAEEKDVSVRRTGERGGDRLRMGPLQGSSWIETPVAHLRAPWEKGIPKRSEVW